MRKLLNTLYVTSENSYLGLDGENIVVFEDNKEKGRLPLHNLEGIVSFGYRGVSPALMGACADKNISLCYLTPQGKFLARITGKIKGNVILREQQFLSCKDETIRLRIAKIVF
jgi:CRISPR-associated protein Cas1